MDHVTVDSPSLRRSRPDGRLLRARAGLAADGVYGSGCGPALVRALLGWNCPTAKYPDVNRCHTMLALRFMRRAHADLEVELP